MPKTTISFAALHNHCIAVDALLPLHYNDRRFLRKHLEKMLKSEDGLSELFLNLNRLFETRSQLTEDE